MTSHYHLLVAIHLVSLLILKVSPSPTPFVPNANLDLKSTHHTVTQNPDCDKPVGNPFDILPSFSLGLTGNDNPNVESKSPALFGDENKQIESEMKDTYDIGLYSAVCWSRIVTTVEDQNGRLINNLTEYAISFETPGDIPDNYLAEYSIEAHNNKYVKKSVQVPITNVRRSGENTVTEKRYITCSSGPLYSRTLIKYKNNKKKLEIRVSPKEQLLTETHKNQEDNKSLMDEICEDISNGEDDEKTTAIKEELLWQIIKDILGMNGGHNVTENSSYANLTALINNKRDELIEKIEEIMPDNVNKTDSILDETIQKIKQDELQSSTTTSKTGVSKIDTSQWGTSTNSEYSTLKKQNSTANTEHTTQLYVSVDLSNNEIEIESSALVKDPSTSAGYETTQSYSTFPQQTEQNTFTIRVTEFVSYRRGVILDEIMRHMNSYCYDISKYILEIECPEQLDTVPTINSTKIPPFATYKYVHLISEAIKRNNFIVTDPKQQTCYILVKVKKVQCPSDTSKLLNLRIVTFAENQKIGTTTISTTENPTSMNTNSSKLSVGYKNISTLAPQTKNSEGDEFQTFTIRVTEFVSYRRGIILDEIMRHMNSYCSNISKNILEIECPVQLNTVPTIDKTKIPSFVSYRNVRHLPEPTDQNNFIVTDPVEKACYVLVKVKEVQCPIDTSKLLNLRIVTYAGNQQIDTTTITTTENPTSMNTDWSKLSVGYKNTSTLAPQTKITEVEQFETFTIRVTEFVSHRRGVILDEIMRHMNSYCYDVSKNIFEIECPAQLDAVPTIDKTKIPSFASYPTVRHISELVKRNNFIVTDPIQKACYVLIKVKKVPCPSDTSNLLNLRIVTFAEKPQAGTTTITTTETTLAPQTDDTEGDEFETFTIRVTEFVSYRRGVILDEIMRHMNTYCYIVSKNILEIECPTQLDTVPTINKTKIPSFASYKYVNHIPESVKLNNFIVTDPIQKACYVLVKVKEVQCPSDTSKLLNLRIVTFAGNQQIGTTTITTTENPTSMNTNWKKTSDGYEIISTLAPQTDDTKVDEFKTFTIRVTEFVSYRRGVILDEIMRHMNSYCYDVYKNILQTNCPEQLDAVPTINKTKIPSFASYKYVNHIPESVKLNNFIVTDPIQKTCYVLVKVKEVQCPTDTSKLLNLRIVTYGGKQEAVGTTSTTATTMTITTIKSTSMTPMKTFIVRITEFVSRRGAILEGILRHMQVYCFEVLKRILQVPCVNYPEYIAEMDTAALPSYVKIILSHYTPDLTDYKNVFVRSTRQNVCYVLTFVKKVSCPSHSTNLVNIRVVDVNKFLNRITMSIENSVRESISHDITFGKTETDLKTNEINSHTSQSNTPPTLLHTVEEGIMQQIKNDSSTANSKTDKNTEKKITENLMKIELINEIIGDLIIKGTPGTTNKEDDVNQIKKELFLEIVEDLVKEKQNEEPKWYFTRYVDLNNITYCFKENNDSILPEACPENTANLEFVSLTQEKYFLARYIDIQNRIHCVHVYNNLLKPTPCKSDTMKNLPIVSPTNERPLLGKYIDNQKIVHCYLQYLNRLEHTTCPSDDSYLPEISMHHQIYVAQYVDYQKHRFCYEVHEDFIKKVPCPSYPLPSLYLSNEQSFVGKIEISKNIEFCYNVYKDHWKPTHCPANTSHVPIIFSSSSNLYMGKITDNRNQDFCYFVNEDSLNPVPCPLDTSYLPVVTPSNGKSYVGRILDAENKEFCFTVYEDSMKPIACPKDTSTLPYIVDTSNLPLAPVQKIVDNLNQIIKNETENNIEENVMKTELINEIIEDLISNSSKPGITNELDDVNQMKKELVLEIVEDLVKEKQNEEPKWYFTRYVDLNNITYCFKENDYAILPEVCPENTANLEFVSLTQEKYFLARYIDIKNRIHCVHVYNNLLKPTPCKSDTMKNLPIVSPTNERPLLGKYIDNQKIVHCYLQYLNRLEHTTCPTDDSYLPEISMHHQIYVAQYVDYQKHRFCYEVHEDIIKKVPCPSYPLPSLYLSNEQSFVGKIEISKNIEFCYNVYKDHWKPTHCPANTSQVPIIFSSSSNLYIGKIRDNRNQDFCYFVNEDSLNPVPCPLDTSYLPVVTPSNGKSYVGRILDTKNREFCFMVYEDSMKPIACQKNTSTLPYISSSSKHEYIGIMETVENGMQCFVVSKDTMKTVSCPEELSNIPYVAPTNQIGYLAKYVDIQNRVHCVYVYNNLLKPTSCKSDTMKNLPIVSPTNDRPLLGKFIDNQKKVHCYLQYRNRLEHTTCPTDDSYLPEISMHHQIYIAQFVDYHEQRFCYEVHDDFIKKVPCPSKPLPALYLSNEQSFVGKIEISKNIEFCYTVYKDHWKPTHCPVNTSDIPIIFSSSSNLYMGKITDNRNQDFCYFVNEDSLNPVPCPLDTSYLPVVTLSNGKSYVGRILDTKNREFCFTVYEDSMKPIACQKDTSTLPYISSSSKHEYIGIMETVENGMQCFVVSKDTMKTVSCPEELSNIPYVAPTNQIGYLARYVDSLNQIKCFMVYNNTMQNTVCPVDTSNLPLAPMSNKLDGSDQNKKSDAEKKIDESLIKAELLNEIIEDLISNSSKPGITNELDDVNQMKKELVLEIVEDLVKGKQNEEPKWYFTRYVDLNNITYCFKENDDSILPEVCPENTANLEFVSLTQEKYFLARYIDIQNRVHCVYVYNNLLKPTSCKSDTMKNLPIVSPTNERPLLVKFIDNQKKVHCYLQYRNRLEHTTCPTDDSYLPEISMHHQIYIAQFVDYHEHRFCYEVHDDFIKKVPCPSKPLPALYLSNEQSFVGKIEISKYIEFCYNVYKDHWKPTHCPANTSQVPIIFSSSSNLYMGKITDNRNQDFCYFVNEDSLNPVPCPLDTSYLPVVTPSNGKSYVGRILDAQSREFCFTVYEDSMKPIACQKDTSTLPYISLAGKQWYIGKMETVENGIQCFVVSKDTMKTVSCPEELSTIPYVTPTDTIGYLAQYVDVLGQTKCFIVYKNSMKNALCPANTVILPSAPTSINSWWYGKYVTAQNEIVCLKIQGETRTRVPCPSNVYMLPTVENVDDLQVIPPNSVTLHQKEIRELIKVMCKDKFYTHFQKNNNSVALQKIRRFLP